MLSMKESTSFKLERNVATLWMPIGSRNVVEKEFVKILPLWLTSVMDAVDEINH